jgi:hypothetical protein
MAGIGAKRKLGWGAACFRFAPISAIRVAMIGRLKSTPKADISFVAGYLAVLNTFI